MLVENELKKPKTFDSSYFIGKTRFQENGTQNYLVFQLICRYFKQIAGVSNGIYIYYWKSKRLCDVRINYIKALNHSITPKVNSYGTKTRVEFNGRYLKQDKTTYTYRKIGSIYAIYEVLCGYSDDYYSRFSAFKLTSMNVLVMEFDLMEKDIFHNQVVEMETNVIILGVDMSSSTNIDNRKEWYLNSW